MHKKKFKQIPGNMAYNGVLYHNVCFLNWSGQKGNLIFVYYRKKPYLSTHTAENIYLCVLLSFIFWRMCVGKGVFWKSLWWYLYDICRLWYSDICMSVPTIDHQLHLDHVGGLAVNMLYIRQDFIQTQVIH